MWRFRKSTKYLFKLCIREQPRSIEWGLTIGDCVHNARAALDFIAWRLAGSDLSDRKTLFPLCIDPGKFSKYRLKRLHPDAAAEIYRLQPCHTPRPVADMLWVLEELDARDKHKLLTTTQTANHSIRFVIDGKLDPFIKIGRRHELNNNAVIAEASFPPNIIQPKVEVNGGSFDIKIKGDGLGVLFRYPVGMVLEKVIKRVEDTIRLFEGLITAHPDWIPS